MIKTILAPIAFDQPGQDSLDYAVKLAAQLGASVCALHVYTIPVYGFPDGVVVTSPELAARLSESAQAHLDAAVDSQKKHGVKVSSVLVTGNPWEEIVEVARARKANLIVMGTHGRHGLAHALLGSVAERVLRTSPIPVLVVRDGATA
jgi:nucleotide-binding universal stress UspA family protein